MITSHQYFENSLTEVNKILFNENNIIALEKRIYVSNFKPQVIHKAYNKLIQSFPYDIQPASKSIIITLYLTELDYLVQECNKEDPNLSKEKINEIKSSRKSIEVDNDGDKCIIYDFLVNYFFSLVYKYDKFIKNAKKYHFFYGIDSEDILLKNLLIIYQSVLRNSSTQIDLISGITLTKELSDYLLKMLIDFIEQRLLVLNPNENLINKSVKINHFQTSIEPIKWNGTQQNLLELFIELIDKKWIEDIEEGKRRKFIKTIINLFDIESTKIKKDSDSENSLYQKFKGELNGKDRNYPFLENETYKKNFNRITKYK